uniref:Putative ATPase domain containing protein n=1 Tax=viral metagenome TaxID=1070528 RepID=A0A6M3JSF3_9ZZZZ
MKILKFAAENFKKLSAVEITPDGNVVVISGKNGAGKSSVLDGIEAALCGGRVLPKRPIKDGEVRGKVEVDMGPYKVTRKFFGANSTLTVTTTGETKTEVRKPQAFLDSVVGSLSFDPLAFLNKQPAEQRDTLMDFLGLNLQDFTDKILSLKAQRSDIRKEKERKLHEAESITFTPNLPEQIQNPGGLLLELDSIRKHNEQCRKIESDNAVTSSRLEQTGKDILAAQKAIEDWKKRLTGLITMKASLEQQLRTAPQLKDSAEVEIKIKTLADTNEAIRRNAQKRAALVDVDIHSSAYRDLGDEIKIVENQKAKKLAETVMPVEGLSILPDGLAYNGIPLEQVNSAKKLEICVAISMALNPKLKVLRVNGNDLDPSSRKAIGELVAGKGYQLWMEVVSEDDKIGFYIEDGHLVGNTDEKGKN